MAKREKRKKGVDEDLDKYLNNDDALETVDETNKAEKPDELETYIETPVDDEKTQREIEKQQKEADRVERERLRALQDEEEQQQQRQVAQQASLQNLATNITDPLVDQSKRAINTVSSASTSGGIGTLIVVLVMLLLILVQVDQEGNTRFKMFWYMLNGRAHLDHRYTPQIPTASSSDQGTTANTVESGTSTSVQGVNDGFRQLVGI